jgi:hypothetical protein
MTVGCGLSMVFSGGELWRWDVSIYLEESKMRQISIVLATAVITATVAVAGVLAVNPNPTRPGGAVPTSTRVDVIEMMKDAKDLPEQSYQAF